jgi:hypothetical protein
MGKRRNLLVRDTDTGSHLELLMVMAVVTILVSRAFLAAAGYPRISPGNLHIAHMLWGGLLMFAALVMLVRYWNPSVRRFGAFLGGIGFGLFIDELGKFITEDNDYFYKPTIALLYVMFIIMYFGFRSLSETSGLSEREIAVNAHLRHDLGDKHDTSSRLLRLYDSLSLKVRAFHDTVVAAKGIVSLLMILFVVLNLAQLGVFFGITGPGWLPGGDTSGISIIGNVASGLMVLAGLLVLRAKPLRAFLWFKRSVLVNIFITQIFVFYRSQLTAVWGLAVNLVFYAAISYHLRKLSQPPAEPISPAGEVY